MSDESAAGCVSVAVFASMYFCAHLEASHQDTGEVLKNFLNFAISFYTCLRWFCLFWKTIK